MPTFNGKPVSLGRRAIKWDSRRLKLHRYLTSELPAPPASVDWSKGETSFGEMRNDSLGCCTIAGCGHAVQIWTANTGTMQTVPNSTILQYYEQWCGYDPANSAATDNGGIEADVLLDWKNEGFAGHQILGYADPSVSNLTEIQQAIHLFGGLYIGLEVPNSAFQQGSIWTLTTDDSGIAGGHCVYVIGYDATTISFITWGSIVKMTISFWNKYVDEAHAILSQDWLAATGAPNGFNLSQLQADLAAIR